MPLHSLISASLIGILLLVESSSAFSPPSSSASSSFASRSSTQTSSLNAFQWPTLDFPWATPDTTKQTGIIIGERNGIDPNYPWRFEGRFIFRPSLVRVPSDRERLPPNTNLLSLFGYSLGGSVVLEYDVSPVGPYREYVVMGGVVGLGRVNLGDDDRTSERKLGLGQWGTDLFVTTQVAEEVCKQVWGVPAQVADIDLIEDGGVLRDGPDEVIGRGMKPKFILSGWNEARVLTNKNEDSSIKRYGNIPIFWTPTIKALWAPISLPGSGSSDASPQQQKELLPVHKLRLSASALSLKWCERIQQTSSAGEIPIGLALVVDNVLIEIGERVTSGTL
eukprot:scaffold693_cov200-Alexandrium_tamarense.AAC.104